MRAKSPSTGYQALLETIFGGVALPEDRIMRNAVDAAIISLDNPREILCIRLYFGLDTGKRMLQKQIASDLGVSTPRIWQIIQKALRKLRHPSRSKPLRIYIVFEDRPPPPPSISFEVHDGYVRYLP